MYVSYLTLKWYRFSLIYDILVNVNMIVSKTQIHDLDKNSI